MIQPGISDDEPRGMGPVGGDGPHKIWACTIGGHSVELFMGADSPMRDAVERAYFEVTGQHATFNFSGWGAQLSDVQAEIVAGQEASDDAPH